MAIIVETIRMVLRFENKIKDAKICLPKQKVEFLRQQAKASFLLM